MLFIGNIWAIPGVVYEFNRVDNPRILLNPTGFMGGVSVGACVSARHNNEPLVG